VRRRAVVAVAAPLLLAAAVVSSVTLGARLGDADEESPLVSAPAGATSTSEPDRKLPRTVATLPRPDPPPTDPYADVPITQVGSISIPKIGLDHAIFEGVWLTVIDHGPGHWPGSAMPGARGNAVLPGHRVTHSHPFRDLDQLAPGDEISFVTADGAFTYVVTETLIVLPTDMWVTDPTPTPTVTLIACHPKGSARERIVVKGELVRSVRV
jgi:sortase A